jgi:hypothetical protein
LTGWAGGVVGVFAASETGTEEGEGDEETPVVTEAPTAMLGDECEEHPEAYPHTDPDG